MPATARCSALLGAFPLLLTAAARLAAVAMVGVAPLEDLLAAPIRTACETVGIEVLVLFGVLREIVDSTSQPTGAPSMPDAPSSWLNIPKYFFFGIGFVYLYPFIYWCTESSAGVVVA